MAVEPIVVRFAAEGVQQVTGAFATVTAQIRRFEEQATREGQRGARTRVKGAQDEARDKEKAYAKLQRDLVRFEQQQTREAAREQKRRDSVVRKSSEMAGREAAKAATAEIREAEKTTRAIEREEERKMRIRIRSSEMAGRAAAREAAEEIRAAEGASRARGRLGGKVGGIVSGSVGGLLGGAATLLGATMGIGGGMMLASAGRAQLSAGRTAALLVNAGTTGGVVPGTMNDALNAASAESIRTGLGKESLLGAALKYSQSAKGGDFAGALANMGMFADLAKVSGADINDVAESAGILQSQNKELQGPSGAKKMRQMMLTVLAGTHEGSMSFADVAKQIGTMGATRSSFAQDETKSQLSLIGMGQIARVGGDVGEAGTFVKDLALEASVANKKWREKHGRDLITMNAHGQMQSPEQMVADVLRGTKGNVATINDLFGKRGAGLFRELSADYMAGEKTGGVEGGVKGALAAIGKVSGAAMTEQQFSAQVKTIDETPGEKFRLALNKITDTIEDKLEPRMEDFASNTLPKLIPKFEAIIDEAAKLADWFVDNPFKGVGAVVLAAITKDLASAGIGAAVKGIISAMLQTAGGGGVAGGAMGAVGKAGWVAAAGAAGGAFAISQVDADIAARGKATAASVMGSTQALAAARNIEGAARRGAVTPADLAAAQGAIPGLAAEAARQQGRVGKNEMGIAQTGMAFLTGHGSELRDLQTQRQKEDYAQAKQALDAMTAAAKAAEKALSSMTANSPKALPPIHSGAPTVPSTSRPVQ